MQGSLTAVENVKLRASKHNGTIACDYHKALQHMTYAVNLGHDVISAEKVRYGLVSYQSPAAEFPDSGSSQCPVDVGWNA
jgi:hypothetical protein